MNAQRNILYLFILCSSSLLIGEELKREHSDLQNEQVSLKFVWYQVKNELIVRCYRAISGCDEVEKIGFLYCTKMPLVPYYILYNFYVRPVYRNRGYGTRLLNYTCDYLAWQGASAIYIQPGPFELQQEISVDMSPCSREVKLRRLIALYKNNRFVPVNTIMQYAACIVYRYMGINEDARYLMVRAC